MQNNLEEITFEEVTDINGTSYAVFRNTLQPRYSKLALDIGKAYFFLIMIAAALVFLQPRIQSYWWILVPVSSILIGYTAAYLALFIHEAAHYNIHPDKKMNDTIATILLCLPFGLSMKSYRKIHWQHHLHLGTPNDAEISYFNAPTPSFLFETFTGLHLLRVAMQRDKNKLLTKDQRRQSTWMLVAGILLHLSICSLAFVTGNWLFGISWILGFVVLFPFFATIRQILEHRDELALAHTDFHKNIHGKVSRLFINNWVTSSFGAAGFTRHMIHHWDPQISYTRLSDIEKFLASSERTASIIRESKTSYTSVFKKLVAAS